MTPWHFTPPLADLPIEQVRERFCHADMTEEMGMIHGQLFWDDTQRFHVLGLLIEASAPRRWSASSSSTAPPPIRLGAFARMGGVELRTRTQNRALASGYSLKHPRMSPPTQLPLNDTILSP